MHLWLHICTLSPQCDVLLLWLGSDTEAAWLENIMFVLMNLLLNPQTRQRLKQRPHVTPQTRMEHIRRLNQSQLPSFYFSD